MGVRMPVFAVAALAAVTLTVATPHPALAADGAVIGAGLESAIGGRHIVELRGSARTAGVDAAAVVLDSTRELTTRFTGRFGYTYQHVMKGFEITASPTAARRIAAHPDTVDRPRLPPANATWPPAGCHRSPSCRSEPAGDQAVHPEMVGHALDGLPPGCR